MRERFEQRTNNAIESIKHAMVDASRELLNCDPKKHVKGMYCLQKRYKLQLFTVCVMSNYV